jgi:hypothetical protein
MRLRYIILGAAVIALIAAAGFSAELSNSGSVAQEDAKKSETMVSVFFGTNIALGAEELRTNAIQALSKKGHTISRWDRCVINVQVAGKEPGCAVLFYDLQAKMSYQDLLNARGEVRHVSGGKMRHSTPGPGDPRPDMPEGGVRVKP